MKARAVYTRPWADSSGRGCRETDRPLRVEKSNLLLF